MSPSYTLQPSPKQSTFGTEFGPRGMLVGIVPTITLLGWLLAPCIRPGLIEGECMENILPNGRCFADITTKMRCAVLMIPLDSPRSSFSIPPPPPPPPPTMMSSSLFR